MLAGLQRLLCRVILCSAEISCKLQWSSSKFGTSRNDFYHLPFDQFLLTSSRAIYYFCGSISPSLMTGWFVLLFLTCVLNLSSPSYTCNYLLNETRRQERTALPAKLDLGASDWLRGRFGPCGGTPGSDCMWSCTVQYSTVQRMCITGTECRTRGLLLQNE